MLNTPAHAREDPAGPVVILRTREGGIEILAEDRTYALPKASLRDLLFLGNRVHLSEDGAESATDWAAAVPNWIAFRLGGEPYLIHRTRFVWVARGDIPADCLRRGGGRR